MIRVGFVPVETSAYLERVTECEHGNMECQLSFGTLTTTGLVRCPGGSRVRVEPDYEAAADQVRRLFDIKMSKVALDSATRVVNAALGVPAGGSYERGLMSDDVSGQILTPPGETS